MVEFANRLRASTFLRHNAIFFVGAVLVGALNYAYYPILGRLLDPAPFGEVQALVSLFLQLAIFLTVLGLVTVNISANYTDQAKRNAVIFELEKLALVISLVLLGLSAVFANQLKDFFRFEDSLPFIVLMVALVATVPLTFRSSFIRGKKQFGKVSIINIIGAAAKIALSAILVMVGLGTVGAIWGVALAQVVAFALTMWWAGRLGLARPAGSKLLSLPDVRVLLPELKYAALVLVCSLIVTAQFSIDIVVVKHYFDAHTAGLYAGIATVARIIFFLTASIAQVLMPSVRLNQLPALNRKLLLKSFGLLSLFAVPCVVVFALYPEAIIGLLMGNEYKHYAHLLPTLGLATFLVAVLNLLVSYYMSLRRYAVAVIVIIGAMVTYTLMFMNHDTLQAVVNSLLYGSITMLGLAALWEGWRWLKGGGTEHENNT